MNYEWLDPYVGYVGSLTRRLDAAIKCTKDYYVVGSWVVFAHIPEAGYVRDTDTWWRHVSILDVCLGRGMTTFVVSERRY